MIQRIQTVWLLLAAICMTLTFKFKFAAGFVTENNINTPKNVTANEHLLSLITIIIFIIVTMATILLFKNRKLQMRIVALNILIGVGCLYSLYWQTTHLNNVTYAIAALLPIFAIGFTISALHCIWQDEKKIKELNSNRLR